MTNHQFRAEWWVKSADEAETWAHEQCAAYFGTKPYIVLIDATEQRAMGNGVVRGYRVSLSAEAVDRD